MTDIERFAKFMQQRDAKQWGGNLLDGKIHPTWEEADPTAREQYMADATIYSAALDVIRRTEGGEVPLITFRSPDEIKARLTTLKAYRDAGFFPTPENADGFASELSWVLGHGEGEGFAGLEES